MPISIKELITKEIINPCKTINIGCELGNYSRELAKGENLVKLLSKNVFYLSTDFNEEDDYFEGKGRYRETPTGSVLYFSNTDEIQKLFSPLFHILDLKNITIPGKNGNHKADYALLQKKVRTN